MPNLTQPLSADQIAELRTKDFTYAYNEGYPDTLSAESFDTLAQSHALLQERLAAIEGFRPVLRSKIQTTKDFQNALDFALKSETPYVNALPLLAAFDSLLNLNASLRGLLEESRARAALGEKQG